MSDYIKREEAIIAVTRAALPDKTADGVPIANGKRSVTDCVRRIKGIPAEDVQPVVHSKWELHGEPPWYVRECPECYEKWFHWSGFSMPNYCPNCGAKMDLLN